MSALKSTASDDKVVFPENFLFGAGSSAYQVEGGWNADGKTSNIWDDACHFRKQLFSTVKPVPITNDDKPTLNPASLFHGPTKFSKMELINYFNEMWFKNDPSVPKSPVLYSSAPVQNPSPDQVNEDTQISAIEKEVEKMLKRKPKVVSYYKGVAIYEQLPDELLRLIFELPAAEDASSGLLYSMYSVTDPKLNTPTGDVACDSYHKLDEDIKILKDLGAKVYRFSLSWTRLYTSGNSRNFNEAGIKYYNDLINALLDNGIKPFVTIHHFDVPRHLQMVGGWSNRAMVHYFEIYADFVFKTFGDRVKLWTTINEPTIATMGYKSHLAAPALGNDMEGVAEYLAIHNMLLAHASVYKLYNEKYRETQKGRISVNVAADWYFPKNKKSQEDIDAAKRALIFQVGIILHPLTFGDYPEIIRTRINENSKRLGISRKRLPEFTDEEKKLVKNSYDFISLNHYFSFTVNALSKDQINELPLSESDENLIKVFTFEEKKLFVNKELHKCVPEGMSLALKWVHETYNKPEIVISENGYGELEGFDLALKRLNYHHGHLTHVLKAINEYGVNVTGYCVWSLMDSMEWFQGYSLKYGIYEVDFNDKNRPRTSKKSTKWFKDLFKTYTLVPPPEIL